MTFVTGTGHAAAGDSASWIMNEAFGCWPRCPRREPGGPLMARPVTLSLLWFAP